MRWAVEHGSNDPEIIKTITYYRMLKDFHLMPEIVDNMDSVFIEELLVIDGKARELENTPKEIKRRELVHG